MFVLWVTKKSHDKTIIVYLSVLTYIHIYIYIYILRASINSCYFLQKLWLYWKSCIMFLFKILFIATTFPNISGSTRIPRRKKSASFEAIHESTHFVVSSYEENFCSDMPCVIDCNKWSTGQYHESTMDGVGFPISTFPSMLSRRYEVEHCHTGELLCHVFARIATFSFNVRPKRSIV